VTRFNILTLFPDTLSCFLGESILKRSLEAGVIQVSLVDIREFSTDKHGKVDDYPFGGGRGMLLRPDPIFRAIESLEQRGEVIFLTPMGVRLDQAMVRELARMPVLTLLCGHYEGVDHRVVQGLVDREVSLGDFVLTGGEIAAAALVDAVIREHEDALGNRASRLEESFDTTGLLEYEQYTRPAEYRGRKVPEVLLSGNHAAIERWRVKRRLANTLDRRPDVLKKLDLSEDYLALLDEIEQERSDERGRRD
jgi:tRNA (guanine37-N1)-methyltransferase